MAGCSFIGERRYLVHPKVAEGGSSAPRATWEEGESRVVSNRTPEGRELWMVWIHVPIVPQFFKNVKSHLLFSVKKYGNHENAVDRRTTGTFRPVRATRLPQMGAASWSRPRVAECYYYCLRRARIQAQLFNDRTIHARLLPQSHAPP